MAPTKGGIGTISLAALVASDLQAPKPAIVPVNASDSPAVETGQTGDLSGQEGPPEKAAKRRKPRVVNDKLAKRGLHLSDSVMMRLTLLALERKQSLSQVANQILSANLPDYVISKAG
jgi:hypothetical protein